jgi:hypothetical protein
VFGFPASIVSLRPLARILSRTVRRGPSLRVCTAVAERDLAAADALARSLAEHEPDAELAVFVLDRDDPEGPGLDPEEFLRLAALYAPEALIGALKPFLLAQALGGCDVAVWLDARRRLTGTLAPLSDVAATHSLALVPVAGSPPAEGPAEELETLRRGVYDAGVLAVSSGGAPFLGWWRERLARHCVADPSRGYWFERRWLNVVPGYFDCAIVRRPLALARAEDVEPAGGYGFELAEDVRARYRDALIDAERRVSPEPPNPLRDGVEALDAWLRPVDGSGRSEDVERPERFEPGVNLVIRRGDAPLDELGRTIACELSALRVPVETIELVLGPDGASLSGLDPRLVPYDTNLVCLNPLDLASFAFHVEAGFFSLRRSIGIWLLEDVPAPDLDHVLGFLDEVWVGSEGACVALAQRTAKPVSVVPVPVTTARPEAQRRLDFVTVASLGGPFSPGAAERANAIGVVRAYAKAFGAADGTNLLVRTTNGRRDVAALEELRLEVDRPDVSVVDGALSGDERRALVASARCYVSLARSSELELPALEAMAAGVSVVATGAGLEVEGFLQVPAQAVPLPEAFRTYWSGDEWLEPDLEAAADLLRSACEPAARLPIGEESLTRFLGDRLGASPRRRRRGLRRLLRS